MHVPLSSGDHTLESYKLLTSFSLQSSRQFFYYEQISLNYVHLAAHSVCVSEKAV